MTTTDKITAAAALLAAIRRANARIDEIPQAIAPLSLAEAYAVQDALMTELGWPVAAWKVGATSAHVQGLLNVKEPLAGPVFAETIYNSPARVQACDVTHRQIECEFAFTLGDAVVPRDGGYTVNDLRPLIDQVFPAIELIGPRFTQVMPLPLGAFVADCVMNAGLVFGAPTAATPAVLDGLLEHEVVLSFGAREAARGTGAEILNGPLQALVWLVNHLGARGLTLPAGCPVSTGTMTGLTEVPRGVEAVADFGVLGRVSVAYVE